ncbi:MULTISPECIES: DUF2066 domain-containing protein [Ectothiorhodospira]|uniref:DUF2066 domain-containing protein n=1 Tax=Ectothiorhodospira marina TaxID=1396821 RepID=A0A1H7L797_9GAMM|nr:MULTISPECIES: DUF2066 domain-containing protein [Ectothiorhodospira]MCG5515694.1 DUF2066 domain-containing protein [Ectothiorhodospira sp. 9100]MCG5518522.1 DUF2066 domain-containing protein [Ectothiorhodospira sp. 9905]SEK94345.1 hypothetical protein SAMN05444515_10727 [Ectothiorhodospira marina]
MKSAVQFRPFLSVVLALAVLAGAPAAAALPPAGLDEAQVPVESRDRPERAEAFSRALSQVVVKLTGDRALAEDERVAEFLEQAPRHVRQYRYREQPDGDDTLWVRFDTAPLEQFLRDSGLPVWGQDRPALLVWMLLQGDGERRLVGDQDAGEARRAMERVARERGLPLIFPLLDMEDQARVGPADVLGGFEDVLREASARYSPDGMLVVRIRESDGGWEGRFQLHADDSDPSWEMRDEGLTGLMRQGVDQVANSLSRQMVVTGLQQDQDGVMVSVAGVSSLSDYLRVGRHLSEMAPVSRVQPRGLDADRALFLVQVRGEARDIERAARLGGTLTPTSLNNDDQEADPVLGFRLIR